MTSSGADTENISNLPRLSFSQVLRIKNIFIFKIKYFFNNCEKLVIKLYLVSWDLKIKQVVFFFRDEMEIFLLFSVKMNCKSRQKEKRFQKKSI